ncbi:hypothetical protein [Rhodopseudomonas sp.]|uniref:hypothetical protein n=1 Tax=Rhodopseudomonas sp. TaxID=1078 RepID=UPI003B3A1A51
MTISFPRVDLLANVGFTGDPLVLVSRQEMSRTADGISIGKDLGSAIWLASFVTEPLRNAVALELEADLDTLDGVINPFEAYDLRRPVPRLYPDGSANDGVLSAVNANNKAIALTGLKAGQIISKGDYLSFDFDGRRALHRVSERVVANGAGATTQFEVRPHLRPGWELGTAVNLREPRGVFNLAPGSVKPKTYNGTQTVISFQAVQIP